MTDTEREANLQAALSRAANHRPAPGDWLKLQPALADAWTVAHPTAWAGVRATHRTQNTQSPE